MLVGVALQARVAAGDSMLSLAKILENMEIGHNVMHGQWDWMNDPQIHSSTWDWDTASTAEAWKHSHNYVHHTYTNIRGKDRDLGYEIMRIDPHQKWHPVYLVQPLYNILLAMFFEWGVAVHDLDFEAIRKGEKSKAQIKRELKGMAGKARTQVVKDYLAFPLLSAALAGGANYARARRSGKRGAAAAAAAGVARKTFRSTAKANAAANVARNVWSYAIIFCGHFPDQTYTFSPDEVADESRGGFYVRQLLGAANIEGSPAVPRHQRQPRLPGRASPLPGHAEHPLRRDRAAGQGHLPPLRAPLQLGPVRPAARRRAAHDPAARVPRRRAPTQAGALPRRRHQAGARRPARASRARASTAPGPSSRPTACASRCPTRTPRRVA